MGMDKSARGLGPEGERCLKSSHRDYARRKKCKIEATCLQSFSFVLGAVLASALSSASCGLALV